MRDHSMSALSANPMSHWRCGHEHDLCKPWHMFLAGRAVLRTLCCSKVRMSAKEQVRRRGWGIGRSRSSDGGEAGRLSWEDVLGK